MALITVGAHKDKTTQIVVLKEPSYVSRLLSESLTGPLLSVKNHVLQHIKVFDAKAYKTRCSGCQAAATRFSVVHGLTTPYWWCDSCDPHGMGASEGKLYVLRTYQNALQYVQFACQGRTSDYRDLIRTMVAAKGAPARIGPAQAEAFLS